jgi:hypothetical protein
LQSHKSNTRSIDFGLKSTRWSRQQNQYAKIRAVTLRAERQRNRCVAPQMLRFETEFFAIWPVAGKSFSGIMLASIHNRSGCA